MKCIKKVLINIKILGKFFCEIKIIVSNYSFDLYELGIKCIIKL